MMAPITRAEKEGIRRDRGSKATAMKMRIETYGPNKGTVIAFTVSNSLYVKRFTRERMTEAGKAYAMGL
jgi:hypothetical protein